MKSLTFVEIDIPVCSLTYGSAPCTASIPTTGAIKCFNTIKTCQDRPNFDETEVTLRFAMPTEYLPAAIDVVEPSIESIAFTPATISLGENLGTRATLSVVFRDAPHSDTGEGFDKYREDRDYDPFKQGTFWGKFRARQPFLRGRSIRWITGLLGQAIEDMETRYFVVESFDGPTPDGKYTLVAKDVLKLVDGDRSQAPALNTGFLVAPITSSDTSLTLSPSGVGDLEYPIEGYLVIGGREVVAFKRWIYDPVANDPYTVVMLHFDGSNGSATFTDSNAAGVSNSWSAVSNALLSTASPKFGTASLINGASAQGILTTAKASLDVAAGDFTIDFVFDLAAGFTTGTGGLAAYGNNVTSQSQWAWEILRSNTATVQFLISNGSSFGSITGIINVNSGKHHIAVTRASGTVRLFVDGTLDGTLSWPGSLPGSLGNLRIGSSLSVGGLPNCFIDEFRYRVGKASWTGNFTPPTAAYTQPAAQITTGDVITLTARGQKNTVAASAAAQDRVQSVLSYAAQDPADIIYDLMVNYAGIPAGFINLSNWQNETGTFLARLYSADICEPTSVATLISELIQQCCLVIWWDDVAQKIRLQVLRGIVTDAARFSPENTLEGSLTVKEQPDKRVSRVQVYFGRINPLKQLSDLDNYRSSSLSIDDEAEEDYGAPVIKTILSRWIPALGRTVADRLGVIQLARFRDPPRRVTFDLMRYAGTDVALGGGYRVASHSLQDETGALVNLPVQVTRLNAPADRFKAEAEEVSFASDLVDTTRYIVVDTNSTNINLRTAHDSLYAAPQSGDVVVCRINAGVLLTSTGRLSPCLDIGSWPSGVDITVIVDGTIEAAGGDGGVAHLPGINSGQTSGLSGGTAIYTRYAIDLEISAGSILWGGGGGGGGGASFGGQGGGGGGGAGRIPGLGGYGGGSGLPGTATAGGTRGVPGPNGYYGGDGGDPGQAGDAGVGSSGGAAGPQIDGVSYVTVTVNLGDRRGPTTG